MKILLKLIPGVAASMAVALVAFAVAQSNSSPAVPVAQTPAPGYVTAPIPLPPAPVQYVTQALPAPQPVMVCGACGARLEHAQPLLVAAPYYPTPQVVYVNRGDGYESEYCDEREVRQRIPLRSIFSLAGRTDPRLIPHVRETRYRN